MHIHRRFTSLVICLLSLFTATVSAENTDAARLAPSSAVVYAELSNPAPLLDLLLSAKTRKLIERSDGYQKFARSEKYQHVQAVVGILEARLGKSWEVALGDLAGGGVSVAFDPASMTGLLTIRSRDRELLAKLNSTLIELVETDAKTHGRPSPVKSKEYQGFMGWTFGGEEVHAIVDDLLLVSNKPEALKQAIDRYRDPALANLAGRPSFSAARAQRPADASGWSWVDLEAVRQNPDVQKQLSKRSDNPVVELLLAGLIDALKQSPYVTSSITCDAGQLRLRTELARRASETGAARAWFFAPATGDAAIQPPGTIGTFTMFRDLAGLWQARDELFDEATVAHFAQADTQLGLFFSGRDFGPEVLGELEPPVQLVVARQEYSPDKPIPALKLPAFALVFKLKHPDDFAPELLMTYQKVIGIVNLTAGQEGRPQFLLSTEEHQGTTISKATYLSHGKAPKEGASPHYNFSPACARVADHFVFGSTVEIVRQIADGLRPGQAAESLQDNTALHIQATTLAAILGDNKELLITQNMLRDAHTRPEAEAAVQMIFDALSQLDRLTLRLAESPETLALETVLNLCSAAGD